MKIRLEKYNPLTVFLGTEAEIDAVERKQERNEKRLATLFSLLVSEKIDTAYITDAPAKSGKYLVKVLHRSAKYEFLQLTTALYENGSFLYFTSDCEIESPEKLCREFPSNGKTVSIK